jgi:predicted TIM-barrel fold metal-dependent hydrolase
VRGVCFNFVRRLVDTTPPDVLRRIAQRIAPLGWHVVIYFEAADLPGLFDFFVSLPTPLVVDHMGRPDVTQPVDGPEFGLFLRLMREKPDILSKVTCPERLSRDGSPGYDDVVPFARTLVDEFPTRVLWGTDWPHVMMKGAMPNDGDLCDLLLQWVPYGLEAAFSEELAAAGHYTRLQKMRSTQALDDWDAANPVTSSRERAAFTELKRLGIYTQQDYYLPSKADEQIYSKRLKEVERKIGRRAGSRGGNPQKPQSTDRARRARRRGH